MLHSHAPCKNVKITFDPDFIFRTILLVFPENKIRTLLICNFLCLSLMSRVSVDRYTTSHKLQCNCRGRMNGQRWSWHHKHSYKT